MNKLNGFWMKRLFILLAFCSFNQVSYSHSKNQEFFIIDSWVSGFFAGLFKNKENRWRAAWNNANKNARNDMHIWGGLFVSDSNLTKGKRFGEVVSRATYQAPQTGLGFFMAHFYNTVLCKVDSISHPNGSTLLSMDVAWAGICFGNYILCRKSAKPDFNNKLFQHEYGHYLQSKRMGFAYLVRVGLPALMSKGVHDYHAVEIDCNREAFLYINKYYPNFQNDSSYTDAKGWNFDYNPFPDTIGTTQQTRFSNYQYLDYQNEEERAHIETLKVKAKWFDYTSWVAFPIQIVVGMCNARSYNKKQLKYEEMKKVEKNISDSIP